VGAQVIRATVKALVVGLVAVGVLMALRVLQLAELILVPVAQAVQRDIILLESLMLRGRLSAHVKAHQLNWSKYEQR